MASFNPTLQEETAGGLRNRSTAPEPETSNPERTLSSHTAHATNGFENGATASNSSGRSAVHGTGGKSLLGYFMTELTKHYRLEADATEFAERRDRVYTSVYTPKNLEKFLAFGFLQCLDSILYMVTFLPLRILVALLRILTYPCTLIFVGRRPLLDGSQVCDLLKGLILVLSCYLTSQVDMSMIYHIVRGQSIMKFYVFFNMLDVMDKLVSQFGQDILDSLYWTAVEPRGRKREHFGTFFHLVFAIVYVDTMIILMQAIILNVAFNSHNKNLLTVMMSNNFVEIKVNVFKRVDKTNLCQITYSDVRERFHYLVLLFFVFARNMKELNWNWDMAFPLLQDFTIVVIVEVFVDWIKHAFITKLSELSANHYGDFSIGLARDIASSQKKHAFTNFSDQVCRRMGFTPIPLICIIYMVCISSFTMKGSFSWLIIGLLYLCLVSTKVLNGIILLGWAQRLLTERDKSDKPANVKGTVINSQTHPKKESGKSPEPAKAQPATGDTEPSKIDSDFSMIGQSLKADSSNQSFPERYLLSSPVSNNSFVPCAAVEAENRQGFIHGQPNSENIFQISSSAPNKQDFVGLKTFSNLEQSSSECTDREKNSSEDRSFRNPGFVQTFHTSQFQQQESSISISSHMQADFASFPSHTLEAAQSPNPFCVSGPVCTQTPTFHPGAGLTSSSTPNSGTSNISAVPSINRSTPVCTCPPIAASTPGSTSIPSASTLRTTHEVKYNPMSQASDDSEAAAVSSSIRSPKRKHSTSSITSTESIQLDSPEAASLSSQAGLENIVPVFSKIDPPGLAAPPKDGKGEPWLVIGDEAFSMSLPEAGSNTSNADHKEQEASKLVSETSSSFGAEKFHGVKCLNDGGSKSEVCVEKTDKTL